MLNFINLNIYYNNEYIVYINYKFLIEKEIIYYDRKG